MSIPGGPMLPSSTRGACETPLAVLGDIGRRSGRVLRHLQNAPSTQGDGANVASSACSLWEYSKVKVRFISSPSGLRVLGALTLLRPCGGRLPPVSQSPAASRHVCGCPRADGGRHEDEARRPR